MKAKTKRYYEALIMNWVMSQIEYCENFNIDHIIELSKSHCIALDGYITDTGSYLIKWWIQYPQTESKIYYL